MNCGRRSTRRPTSSPADRCFASIASLFTRFSLLDHRHDGIQGIEPLLIETYFGEVDSEFFFEKDREIDSVDRLQASREDEGGFIIKRMSIAFSGKQFLNEFAKCRFVVHFIPQETKLKRCA